MLWSKGIEIVLSLFSYLCGIMIDNNIKWRRQWHPTPVLLPGKSHGQRSLVGCSPWGHKELDTTERPHFLFSPLCIGEGNGNPLQYSCLENPMDRGAWQAIVHGVTKSWTRLSDLFFFMVYESNKNFVCSYLLKYTENKMPKQEEVKSVLSFISYQQSMLL